MGLSIFDTNSTAQATWVDSPDGRGTWDILSSCIITLSLCVYTAIHLNIPGPEWSVGYKAGMKFTWLLIALLGPEFIVYNAWRERREAQEIVRLLQQYYGQPHASSRQYLATLYPTALYKRLWKSWRLWRWVRGKEKEPLTKDVNDESYTLVHGFYFLMGGLCFDMTDDPERVWPHNVNRLTLTPEGIRYLLERFPRVSLPYISEEEIFDKSKANHLAKAIVCLQALWFCVQFFGRIGMGLPVTLLELNTFAHSVCALLVYMLWWDKPLDIEEPTTIESRISEAARDFCAWGYSKDCYSSYWIIVSGKRGRKYRYEEADEDLLIAYFEPVTRQSNKTFQGKIVGTKRRQPSPHSFPNQQPPIPRFKGLGTEEQSYLFTCYNPPIVQLQPTQFIPGTEIKISNRFASLEVDEIMLARLQRIARLRNSPEQIMTIAGEDRHNRTRLLRKHEPNFTLHSILTQERFGVWEWDIIQVAAVSVSGLFYGGLHALSWGSPALRTSVEVILWQISCLSILGTGPLFVIVNWVIKLFFDNDNLTGINKNPKWYSYHWMLISSTYLLVFLILPLLLLLYFFSRVFLIVEVFLSLQYADSAVYQTPNWSPYWPHIS